MSDIIISMKYSNSSFMNHPKTVTEFKALMDCLQQAIKLKDIPAITLYAFQLIPTIAETEVK